MRNRHKQRHRPDPTRRTSFFRGMKDRTSLFILLSRKGLRISCSFDTTLDCCSSPTMSSTSVCLPMFLNPNQLWNTSRLSKIMGFTKFSSDQSSSNVFCHHHCHDHHHHHRHRQVVTISTQWNHMMYAVIVVAGRTM